jgi:hypothetical protein
MMIARYGADAIVQAATQGNALLAKGDVDGLMASVAVITAIGRLQRGRQWRARRCTDIAASTGTRKSRLTFISSAAPAADRWSLS